MAAAQRGPDGAVHRGPAGDAPEGEARKDQVSPDLTAFLNMPNVVFVQSSYLCTDVNYARVRQTPGVHSASMS